MRIAIVLHVVSPSPTQADHGDMVSLLARLDHISRTSFASMHPDAEAVQLVRTLRQEEARPPVAIADAARWLGNLSA